MIVFVNREVIAHVTQQHQRMVTYFFLKVDIQILFWLRSHIQRQGPTCPFTYWKLMKSISILTATTETLQSWPPDWIWCRHHFQPTANNKCKLALLCKW